MQSTVINGFSSSFKARSAIVAARFAAIAARAVKYRAIWGRYTFMASAKAVAFNARVAFYQLSGKGIPIIYSVPRYPQISDPFLLRTIRLESPENRRP